MPGLIDSATAVLTTAERRLEVSAQNVANAATAGFKRQISFADALMQANSSGRAEMRHYFDFSQGRLTETGRPLDLAVFGPGLLMLRDGESHVYSRGGHFSRGPDGILADAAGRVLQHDGGGDLAVRGERIEFLDDGTVLEDGLPTARIAMREHRDPAALDPLGGSTFSADPSGMDTAANSQLRPGFVENSNVVMSDEMVGMMATVRQAESGARLVRTYDQMIGQAISTFSRSGR